MEQVVVQHKQRSATITREANTTQYAAGDVIAASTTAAVASVFNSCSGPGRSGSIKSVLLVDSAAEATKLNADLFLFHSAPVTFGNDNEAFAPTDAELQDCVGVVSLDGTTAANIKVGSGNAVIQNSGLDLPFECLTTDFSLYGILVARNTYTPVSAEAFKIILGIQQG